MLHSPKGCQAMNIYIISTLYPLLVHSEDSISSHSRFSIFRTFSVASMQSLAFLFLSSLALAIASGIPPPLSTCILNGVEPCPSGSTCTPTQTCGYVYQGVTRRCQFRFQSIIAPEKLGGSELRFHSIRILHAPFAVSRCLMLMVHS